MKDRCETSALQCGAQAAFWFKCYRKSKTKRTPPHSTLLMIQKLKYHHRKHDLIPCVLSIYSVCKNMALLTAFLGRRSFGWGRGSSCINILVLVLQESRQLLLVLLFRKFHCILEEVFEVWLLRYPLINVLPIVLCHPISDRITLKLI